LGAPTCSPGCYLEGPDPLDPFGMHGNFDIILDHFRRISQLHPTPHALCAVFYLVPRLYPMLICACVTIL